MSIVPVKALRTLSNKTQEEYATVLEISYGLYSCFESGRISLNTPMSINFYERLIEKSEILGLDKEQCRTFISTCYSIEQAKIPTKEKNIKVLFEAYKVLVGNEFREGLDKGLEYCLEKKIK